MSFLTKPAPVYVRSRRAHALPSQRRRASIREQSTSIKRQPTRPKLQIPEQIPEEIPEGITEEVPQEIPQEQAPKAIPAPAKSKKDTDFISTVFLTEQMPVIHRSDKDLISSLFLTEQLDCESSEGSSDEGDHC